MYNVYIHFFLCTELYFQTDCIGMISMQLDDLMKLE